MNIIYKTLVGSKLYGLETSDSDTDIKGVFIPNEKDILLHRYHPVQDISSNKGSFKANSHEDTDEVYFSLDKFVTLLLQADTTAFDMLHAPVNKTFILSDELVYLRENRHKFYTTTLDGLFGQVIKEVAQYGVRGLRAQILKEVLDFVNTWPETPDDRLRNYFHLLPIDDVHTTMFTDTNQRAGCQQFYVILGRKFQLTLQVKDFKRALNKLWDEYGDRAKRIELSGGMDWKAMSHAFRIGYQLLGIYQEGDYTFPLRENPFLMEVKTGQYEQAHLVERLNILIEEVKTASVKSGLPAEIVQEPWYDWVADVYANRIKMHY